jgi:hypothetical protein
MCGKKNVYGVLMGKPEGNSPLEDLGIDRGGMDWIKLAQDRGKWQAVVDMVMNLHVL